LTFTGLAFTIKKLKQKEQQMKKFITFCFLSIISLNAMAFSGFYQTIDDKINKPKSIVALYEYKDKDGAAKLGGRIIALYDLDTGKISETMLAPKRVADKVTGSPKMAGLDIIWDMEKDGDEYSDGRIMDPKNGSVYRSVIWQEDNETTKLHVRGKIGPFGRTQVWNVLTVKDLPQELQKIDTKNWTPKLYE
jgi:uncharacterized protein (DUF2147 family)